MLSGTDKLSRIILIGLLCLLALSQIACGQSSAQREQERVAQVIKYEEAAKQFRENGNFQEALQEQKKAVELNPDDDESLKLLGGIYIELKQYEKAVKVLEKGKQINPNNDAIRFELSWALEELGNQNKSLSELKEAVRLAPKNPMYLTNLGIAYGKIEDKELQEESYKKALAIDPDYLDAMYNLALLEAEQNNGKRAIELFKKFIEKSSPDDKGIEIAKAKLKELEQSNK